MDNVEDVELLARARRGDQDAFTQLFARHQRAIFRYAVHMCGRDAGDDVVQETFLAVLKEGGKFDAARGTVSTYLLGIARHRALKRLAARGEAIDVDGAEATSTRFAIQPTILDDLSRAEAAGALRAAIATLPAAFREAIVLCDLEELDYVEAAAVMQCPIGTVRSRVHRGRAMLAGRLAARVVQEVPQELK